MTSPDQSCERTAGPRTNCTDSDGYYTRLSHWLPVSNLTLEFDPFREIVVVEKITLTWGLRITAMQKRLLSSSRSCSVDGAE